MQHWFVIPAQAGIQEGRRYTRFRQSNPWTPAFAGVTVSPAIETFHLFVNVIRRSVEANSYDCR